MNIGIIGSGNMGSGLGKIWAHKGHQVIFSLSRHPKKLKELAASVPNARAASPREAVELSDVVLLAVKWADVKEALKAAGSFKGKILIDCTNPFKPDLSGLAIGHRTSAAEEISRLARGASVVKAFNTAFAELYHANTRLFGSRRATMFYCGDDPAAKKKVEQLIKEVGFEPVDGGPLVVARYLEPLAMFIMNLGYLRGMGTRIAVSLIRR